MIDSHAHLYFDSFDDDRVGVIHRAREAGVEEIINIGIDLPSSEKAIDLSTAEGRMHATIGIHPTTVVADLDTAVAELRTLAGAHKECIVGIGEIGLDYYWKEVPPEAQRPKLVAQLNLALQCDLPVVFHCRDALDDLFAVLEAQPHLPQGVFHCFQGGPRDAERALALGFHISFAGNVTYPKAQDLQAAARAVPAEKLLLETDAPFLPPQPRRGKRNEPAFLPFTCEFLAQLKGLEKQHLATLATDATRGLFRLG